MSMTKFASLESAKLLEVKSSPSKVKTASLDKMSDFHEYRTEDGYVYARIRAISSRVNKNHDGWPTAELAGGQEAWEKISSQHTAGTGFTVESSKDADKGFSTFVGKPNFIDHHNSDPSRARGVVADSKFRILDEKTASEDEYWSQQDIDPEHLPAAEVELLIEIDAESFPKYAKAVVDGDLDGFSMGCDVDYSKCSHCGHEAETPDEYCSHIVAKGAEFDFTSSDGKVSSRKSYENCYGIRFFEISGVFDPADETALAKEIRAESKTATLPDSATIQIPCSECQGVGYLGGQPCPTCLGTGVATAPPQQISVPGEDGIAPELKRTQYSPMPTEVPIGGIGVTPRYQGSYLGSKMADIQPDEPQHMHTKAPEDVDTLREESVCPLCGSNMDNGKCDVCGYEEPPESLQNPDLTQAQQNDFGEDLGQNPDQSEAFQLPETGAQSYLDARKPVAASTLTSEMRWAPKIDLTRIAASGPQGDEPIETVTSDPDTPVTSVFRTAKEMIEAAKHNPRGNNMSEDVTKVAADPADPSGKAEKRVDVEGTGGVEDASNEQASKADKQTDVEGKGGIIDDSNAAASAPDSTESITQTSDNAGFQPGGEVGDKTQTWDNSNEPDSAVTDKAFPTAAKKGTDPVDPVGKAQDRIDVEQPPHDQLGDETKTWSGTGGNGVTKQQDPVTNKPTQSGGITSGFVSLAALKLAEVEVGLGLIDNDDKLNRIVELSSQPEAEIVAQTAALSRVKTAGLTRIASKDGASRVPSFKRIASEETPAPQPVDNAVLDSALYS